MWGTCYSSTGTAGHSARYDSSLWQSWAVKQLFKPLCAFWSSTTGASFQCCAFSLHHPTSVVHLYFHLFKGHVCLGTNGEMVPITEEVSPYTAQCCLKQKPHACFVCKLHLTDNIGVLRSNSEQMTSFLQLHAHSGSYYTILFHIHMLTV